MVALKCWCPLQVEHLQVVKLTHMGTKKYKNKAVSSLLPLMLGATGRIRRVQSTRAQPKPVGYTAIPIVGRTSLSSFFKVTQNGAVKYVCD